MRHYTNKSVITRTSKDGGGMIDKTPDVKTLIREYTRLLLQYNELARLHGMEIEKPIDFHSLTTTINDDLLVACILRLRRAIKRLRNIRDPEPDPEPDPKPDPEPITWYALVIDDTPPVLPVGYENKGFIVDMYYYQRTYNGNIETDLIWKPFANVINDSDNEHNKAALSANAQPYERIIFTNGSGKTYNVTSNSLHDMDVSSIKTIEELSELTTINGYSILKNYCSSQSSVNIIAYKTKEDYDEEEGVVIRQATGSA